MKKIIMLSMFFIFTVLIFVLLNNKGSEIEDYSKKISICEIENSNSSGNEQYLLPCLENIFHKDGDFIINAKAYIDLSKNNQGLGVYCHQILHYIGKNYPLENYQNIQSNKIDFEYILPSCGYGFLHGSFENVPLTGNSINDQNLLYNICEPLSELSNKNVKLECFHAIGHSVSDSYGSIEESKNFCSEVYKSNNQALIGCFGGLAMKIRDEVLIKINMGEKFPPTLAWFREIGKSCQNSDFLWRISCAPGFVQLATDQGIEYVKPFLLWCDDTLKPENAQCYQQAGVYMGHFKDKIGSAEEIVAVCQDATKDSKNISICINSIPEGRLNAGSSIEDAVSFLCRSRDEFKYCDGIYGKYIEL